MRDQSPLSDAHRRLEFIQLTVDQARVAVFWCDSDGFFFHVNDIACEWLQYSREELMEMHVADINPEFPRKAWADHWAEIKEKGMVRIESVHRRKNGEVYPVEIYSNCVEFEGRPYKLAFVHDISPRRQAQDEAAQLEARLRSAQKMEAIGTLAGGVAHDLNNLLMPVLGYAELILEGLGSEGETRDCAERILLAGRRARDVVGQLLAFSRRQPVEMEPVDVNGVIQDFRKFLEHTIRDDVDLELVLGEELPPVDADVSQVEQILLNLTANAQEAMPDGGSLRIETGLVRTDEGAAGGPEVQIVVTDTGIGMDAETRDRIFEPFFTAGPGAGGAGLGLATVYGIVQQHHGRIHVRSEPGQGSTFEVRLPPSSHDVEDSAADRERAGLAGGGPETILVVEDQEDVLDLACRILDLQGYRVLRARTVSEALDLSAANSGAIDLLFTDVVMPEMNGKELHRKLLRSGQPGLKALFTSGYTENIVVHHGATEEGVHFLQKPYSGRILGARIREVLGG